MQTLKKKSLKVSVLAELHGNFLRKSRAVMVFCCLERISVCDSGCEETEEGNDLNLTKNPRIFYQ